MRKSVFVVSLFALTLAVAPACATKKFVRTEVGQVNEKVGTMGKSLEETQERVRQAEGRIAEVDTKAGRGTELSHAGAAAATRRQQRPAKSAPRADARAEAIEAAARKLLFEVVLSEDQGKFKFGNDRAAGRSHRPRSTKW